MKRVLFACVHNAGRSQMAAAWFNALVDPSHATAISAGTNPGDRVHAEVVTAMKEVGVDLSLQRPTLLSQAVARSADLLITLGCGEACPVVPGLEREDWPVADPKGATVERVREIRDELQVRVSALAESRGWRRP